eukprot:2750400-Pyramimonas_sp.AAC.3
MSRAGFSRPSEAGRQVAARAHARNLTAFRKRNYSVHRLQIVVGIGSHSEGSLLLRLRQTRKKNLRKGVTTR